MSLLLKIIHKELLIVNYQILGPQLENILAKIIYQLCITTNSLVIINSKLLRGQQLR